MQTCIFFLQVGVQISGQPCASFGETYQNCYSLDKLYKSVRCRSAREYVAHRCPLNQDRGSRQLIPCHPCWVAQIYSTSQFAIQCHGRICVRLSDVIVPDACLAFKHDVMQEWSSSDAMQSLLISEVSDSLASLMQLFTSQ